MKKGEWGHFEWQPYFFWLIYHPQKSMDGYEMLRQDEVLFSIRRGCWGQEAELPQLPG